MEEATEGEQPARLVVFLDWQNIYKRARECFFEIEGKHTEGQVDPLDLADLLASRGHASHPRTVTQVRIYKGMPDQAFDEKSYAAARRQTQKWSLNKRIELVSSTLRYPIGWTREKPNGSPREKGIDVALAVDLVTMAVNDEFDHAVVMSSDHDIDPAVSFVRRLMQQGGPRVEVAAWKGARTNRIATGGGIFCHWLDKNDYWSVEDDTDYASAAGQAATTRPVPRPPDRWAGGR